MHRHLGPRLVLASGLGLGLLAALAMALGRPHMLASNYTVYHHSVESVIAGGDLYGVAPPGYPGFYFLYPPAIILAFVPFGILGLWPGYAAFTSLSILGGIVLAWCCLQMMERLGVPHDRIDQVLIVGFCLAAPHVVPTLVFGNVNLLLAGGLAAGLLALERNKHAAAGALVGAVASVKVFPALVGVWFLRRKSVPALGGALAVGGGVVALGIGLFGLEVTQHYFLEILLERGDEAEAITDPRRAFVSIGRPLAHLLPIGGLWLIVAGVLLVGPIVGYAYTVVERPLDRLVAIFVTIAATIIVVPSFFTYYPLLFFPLIPLLFVLDGRPRVVFLLGAAVGNVTLTARNSHLIERVAPEWLASGLIGVLESLLAILSFPLVGILVMLLGCCWYVHERRGGIR